MNGRARRTSAISSAVMFQTWASLQLVTRTFRMTPPFPTARPDLLKLARAVEDAIQSVVYRNDSQIVDEVLHKRYGEPARVEVVLVEL